MAEGDGTRSIIDLIVSLKTEGLGQLDNAKDKVNDAMDSMSSSSEELDEQTSELSSGIEENAAAADELGQSFMRATGQGLALLFAGRFLSQTFGGLSRSMFEMLGVTDMFSATMKTILLPAFLAVQPVLMNIMEAFMGLDENTKMVIGGFVLLATALAPIIMILGQAMAMMAAFGIGTAAVVGALSTLGSVLAVAAAGVAIFLAGLKLGAATAENVSIFIDMLKTNLRLLVGMIKRLFRGEWRSAWGMFKAIVKNTIEGFKKMFIDDFVGFFEKWFPELTQKAKDFAGSMADALRDKIRDALDWIGKKIEWVQDKLSSVGSRARSIVPGGSNGGTRVNDFVMSDGRLLKTHPNDVLFGMKNPDQLGRTGGGQNITINVDRPQLNNEMDVDRMVERIKKDLDRDTTGRSGLR